VRNELRRLRFSVVDDGSAATVVALARAIDTSRGAVAAAQAANVLRQMLIDLRTRADERPVEADPVDELIERRRRRRMGGS